MITYQEYKESGLDWIGEIPNSWDIQRLKYFSNVVLSSVDRHIMEEELGVSICHYPNVYNNEVINKATLLPSGTCTESEFSKFQLKTGDILLTKDSETPFDIGIPTFIEEDLENTVCGYHLSQITPICKNIFPKFLYRFIQSDFVSSYFETEANGITRYGLGKPSIKNVSVFLPPLHEQKQISNYLDRKTQQIEDLIEKTKLKVELLKEQRSSLVNHCVTKGLDPNVEMKDSGVEWIGEIPKEWRIIPMRYLGRYSNGVSKGSEFFGEGFPFVTYSDVYNNDVVPKPSGLFKSTQRDWEAYSVEYGDIFFTRTSETNDDIGISSVCLRTIEKSSFSGFLIRFRPISDEIDVNYSRYFFRSFIPNTHFSKEMMQVTRSSLSQELIKRTPITLPPLSEQKQISRYLDHKTSKIDQMVNAETKRIDLLTEYRKSLICFAVTGKMRITEDMM